MGLLRFILAVTVILAHTGPIMGLTFVGGQLAVQAFYIISGFYMTLILNEKYIGASSYKLFITNRLLRLFPIYWTVLLLTILFSIISSALKSNHFDCLNHYIHFFSVMKPGSLIYLLFTNFFLFLQDTVMFFGLNTSTGHLFFTQNFWDTTPLLHNFLFIPQAWSVGVEITFYLIAPFLVRKKVRFIIPLILLSIVLRVILMRIGLRNDPWSYRFFPTELVFFLLGIISYRAYKFLQPKIKSTVYLKIIWGCILGFTLLFNVLPVKYKGYLYLISFFLCLPFVFLLTKKWKYDRYIGELSYGIYISHMFVLSCIHLLKIPTFGQLGIVTTIITIVFAILLNELVAKRIETFRQKRVLQSFSSMDAQLFPSKQGVRGHDEVVSEIREAKMN